ncbi:hypothetical protein [Vulcanisaeta distributa]|uniref:Uncharacterized protein n=1 Tax=Vulcanisaeta distributa (strain DSM 14429 / JCM 11212 / NBRC 100878 / IC-017) TaxID=572478 RepID=E1QSE5_VULDI|nr:hypothetical protein [Vulcanisaeta distributa]ADN49538.1 hypothetical protein Vdis_0125 [Vulcanisaeta distributa DSM 14429]
MSPAKAIDEALVIIGKARMGRISCNEALDRLWEILVNLDFELKIANTVDGEVLELKS